LTRLLGRLGPALEERKLGPAVGGLLFMNLGTQMLEVAIGFGLSRSAPLSFVALLATGYADMYSMNIRSTTAALATPDPLRGRVTAVEMVFISASNQLGAFESGLAAFLLGVTPAVVAGGAITIGLALAWQRLFPSLATVNRMEDVRPPARVGEPHAATS
jgi:hypothetical protein